MENKSISGHFLRKTTVDKENDVVAYTFVASTDDPDRHRTVLNQDGWQLDNFRINPIIGYQHNLYGDMCNAPDPDDVIGKGIRVYIEEGKLMVDIEFDQENEKARKIESKVDRGFLSTVSVGFIEIGQGEMGQKDLGQDVELYYFSGQELLEISVVNIPSNSKAAKRSFRNQTFDALKYIYRELGGKFKFSEIENMRIGEVLDLMEGKEITTIEETVEPPTVRRYMHKGKVVKEI